MKSNVLLISGLLALTGASSAQADDWLAARKSATFAGATAAGVALGGPLGLVGGAVLGAWLAQGQEDLVDTQLALTSTQGELDISREALVATRERLAEARASSEQYAQLVLDQLQLEMLFKTGATELSPAGHMRLATLAAFLVANPEIAIRLDGYADPRGDADYNRQLSLGRASHVARVLVERGVDPQRIETYGHGDVESTAPEGDIDAYALERAVKINLSHGGAESVAATH